MNTLSPVEQSKWAHLKASGLHEDVESLQNYKSEVSRGLSYAHMNLCRQDGFPMNPTIVKQSHKIAYGEVAVDAGDFRTQDAAIGGLQSSSADRIPSEMRMLEAQSAFLFDHAKTPTQILEATAFTHAKLMRIRPFKDGNGQVGQMFLLAHLREGIQVPMDLIANELADKKTDHVKALNSSYTSNDLTPLMGFLAKSIEQSEPSVGKIPVPERNPTPFDLAPSPVVSFNDTPSVSDDLLNSRNLEWFNNFPNRPEQSDFRIPAGNLPPITDWKGHHIVEDQQVNLKKLRYSDVSDI